MENRADKNQQPAGRSLAPLMFRVSWLRLLGMGLLAALFVTAGVYIWFSSPEWGLKIVGLICVLFFGGGYGAVVVKQLLDPIVLELSVDGIKPRSGGFIPWEDFEAVGLGRMEAAAGGTPAIGIRLKSYEGYISSLTVNQRRLARGTAVTAKFTGSVLRRSVPSTELRRSGGGLRAVAGLPQRDLSGMLQWNRAISGGWDLTFSPHLFSGPAHSVVQEIEAYYSSALIVRSGR